MSTDCFLRGNIFCNLLTFPLDVIINVMKIDNKSQSNTNKKQLRLLFFERSNDP